MSRSPAVIGVGRRLGGRRRPATTAGPARAATDTPDWGGLNPDSQRRLSAALGSRVGTLIDRTRQDPSAERVLAERGHVAARDASRTRSSAAVAARPADHSGLGATSSANSHPRARHSHRHIGRNAAADALTFVAAGGLLDGYVVEMD